MSKPKWQYPKTRVRSREFLALLDTVEDDGLKIPLFYAGDGEVVRFSLELDGLIRSKGFSLTTYNYRDKDEPNSFRRRWAVFQSDNGRPRHFDACLCGSGVYPNIGKTAKCAAYKQLVVLRKKLLMLGIL